MPISQYLIEVKRIGTVIVPTVWSSIVNFFAMFAIIPFFVGIYCTDTFAGIHLKAGSVYFG
ncbi:hypothetical protein NIB75_01930 [Bacteroides uniformis]|nr:hypothetical protein [Bacteroides uniformis]